MPTVRLTAAKPLIEAASGYTPRFGIVIEPLPARAGIAAARRAGVAPDPAVVVTLKELIATRRDRNGFRIVIQHLPA
jgi:hypothetical protein